MSSPGYSCFLKAGLVPAASSLNHLSFTFTALAPRNPDSSAGRHSGLGGLGCFRISLRFSYSLPFWDIVSLSQRREINQVPEDRKDSRKIM